MLIMRDGDKGGNLYIMGCGISNYVSSTCIEGDLG